ncbi:MAG: hypothetical protein H5T43_02145 [Methanomethylovorans sp.]|jgi:hypothetical protein|nr:hypothetical protein [Methanomethylovorans sp.]
MLKIHWLIVALMVAAFFVGPAAAHVERTITSADVEGVITVRLEFPQNTIGGVTEVIPQGYEFMVTEHPADQTLAEANKVHFAVIGEEEIVYSLKGTGTPRITGTWTDLRAEEAETIIDNNKAPGFGIVSGCFACICIALLRRQYR